MISSHEIPNEVLYESFTHVQEMSSDHLYFKMLLKKNFNKILQIIKEFKIPRREGAAHPPLFPKAAQNVKQGGHSFLNSLNSLNGYWIFVVLELLLKNTIFWLFLKCSWKVIFVSDAHKVYSFIQWSSLDKKSYIWVLNNIWLKFVGCKATYKWCAISG